MIRVATAFAYLMLALGVVGVVHSSWLDWGIGATGVRLEPGAAGDAWRVAAVDPESPGERAGLRAGDRVLAVSDAWHRRAVPARPVHRACVSPWRRPDHGVRRRHAQQAGALLCGGRCLGRPPIAAPDAHPR